MDRLLKSNTAKTRALVIPPGLHALRTDPEHAAASADAAVRGNDGQQRAVWQVSTSSEMRGRVSRHPFGEFEDVVPHPVRRFLVGGKRFVGAVKPVDRD